MRCPVLAVLVACSVGLAPAGAQPSRQPARAPALKTEPIAMKCPARLGTGVETKREFCDVLTGIDPAEGVLLPLPARAGEATLTFDLHNRHTYSEAQVQAGRAFARYTATIVLATLKGEVLGRATVQSEFRTPGDLVDRIGGGAGPGGVKAVAPVGTEPIVFTVPPDVTEIVVLGERLTVERLGAREVFVSAGRPIAIISNPVLEYRPRPAPVRRPTRRPR